MKLPKLILLNASQNVYALAFGGIAMTMMVNGTIFNWENYFRLCSSSIRKQASSK